MNTKQKKATLSLCEPVAFEKSVGLSADGTRVCVQEDSTTDLGLLSSADAGAKIWTQIIEYLSWTTPPGLIEQHDLHLARAELNETTLNIYLTPLNAGWLSDYAASAIRPLETAARFAGYPELEIQICGEGRADV